MTQNPNESVNAFALRLCPAVRKAYAGNTEKDIMAIMTEEFVVKLRDPLPLLMAGQVYSDFQEARTVAETIEAQLKKREQPAPIAAVQTVEHYCDPYSQGQFYGYEPDWTNAPHPAEYQGFANSPNLPFHSQYQGNYNLQNQNFVSP